MSRPDSFLTFSKLLQTETVTANAAGTDIALPPRKTISISVDGKCFIKWSNDGTDAAATDVLIPGVGVYSWDTGPWAYLSIFAHSGGNVITSVFEHGNT